MPLELSAAVALGLALGVCSGLVPGLHVNNFAFLLAGAAPALGSAFSPTAVGVAMVSAAVAHTYLDVVPSVALGVPDDSMALAALPGHRMVLDGDGREAIALSAMGSTLGLAFAFAVALPLSLVMSRIYGALEQQMAVLLAAVVVFLLLTERGGEVGRRRGRTRSLGASLRIRFAAAYVMVASGALGAYVFRLEDADAGTALVGEPTLLMPLFVGLYAVPLLAVSAFENAELPPQSTAETAYPRRSLAVSSTGGGFAGSLVGWLPAVSPAVATTMVQTFLPQSETEERSMRSFVVAVSAVDTSNAVFATLALYYIGRPRSGVMVAFEELGLSLDIEVVATLMAAIAVSSLGAYLVTVWLSGRVFRVLRGLDYRALCVSVGVLLVVLTYAFSGVAGIPVLAAATAIGLVPNYSRVRRVNCMGCLLLPLIAFYL